MPTTMRSGSRPAQRTTRNPAEPRSPESTTTGQTDERAQQFYARISKRAYALYEQHGRRDGHALDDWLEAERQVVNENLWRDVEASPTLPYSMHLGRTARWRNVSIPYR